MLFISYVMKNLIIVFLFLFQEFSFLFGQITPNKLGDLPNSVSETSGLFFYNNRIITHNDSGNLPQLYEIDTLSLAVTRTVNISNATNVDWEDIAQDETYIYIGDFGNNKGTRTDLAVYRILKEDYNTLDTVIADKINFTYQNQTNFMDTGNSDWDAEAMFVLNDQLVILTKQWKSLGTVAYSIPKTPGDYSATKLDSYSINGLVTGASYNLEEDVLMLIGYTNTLAPFLYQVKGVGKTSVFGGEVDNLNISISNAQVEGITFISKNRWFFSSESFREEVASLYSFSLKEKEIIEEPEIEKNDLLLYYRKGENKVFYELPNDVVIFGRALYDVTGKRLSYSLVNGLENNFVNTSSLESAIYYLTVYGRDGIFSKPFIKN